MATSVQRTYQDAGSRKESILEEIEILSSLEDNFLTTLEKSSAADTVHQTLTDTLRTPQSRAAAEGADATLVGTTAPQRVPNVTEIVTIPYGVSGTQRAVDHYGMSDAFARETVKAMKDWKNAAEFDLVRSTLVSGVSGTAPKMAGIIAGITTNATVQTSGTVFSESILNGLLELNWTNGNGEVASDLYVGAHMKRKISGFAGRTGSTVVTKDMVTAVNTIDFYISDFGEHRVHLHRYVFQTSDATDRILGVRPDKWAIAYLREPVKEDLAKTGDSTRAQIIGELTLENKNEKTNFYASGFHKVS